MCILVRTHTIWREEGFPSSKQDVGNEKNHSMQKLL